MPLVLLGSPQLDLRTNTPVIYAQMPVNEYLVLVGDDFDKFSIQRRREKHPAYARMKDDIRQGALLPAITLSVAIERAREIKGIVESGDLVALAEQLVRPGGVNILDGLQRTYILKDLANENFQFMDDQTVHLEIRIEEELDNLIYRIIVLNAGQKPMSMRHQIEVLFSAFRNSLQADIQGLELYVENEAARRTRSRKYALDRIATAYHAFLLKSPEVEKQNVVAQQISEESVLSQDEKTLGEEFLLFRQYLEQYVLLDDQICRVYDGTNINIPTGANWFGSENVMNSFFAAVADFGSNESRKERINSAINILINNLTLAAVGSDPLGLEVFQQIVHGLPVRKVNVGFATRKLLNIGFKEFFRDEGERPLAEIWEREAE